MTEKYYADIPALASHFRTLTEQRTPDFIIGPHTDPYMLRWWVIPRNHYQNVYLHLIFKSDDERALHDHPWDNSSLVLENDYIEVLPGDKRIARHPGDIVHRRAADAHRLEIPGRPVMSLFTTGPQVREWGFHCPNGWRHWREFTSLSIDGKSSLRGIGCE